MSSLTYLAISPTPKSGLSHQTSSRTNFRARHALKVGWTYWQGLSVCIWPSLLTPRFPRKASPFSPGRWSIYLPLIELISSSMSVRTHSSCLCLAGRFSCDLLSPWHLQSHCSFQGRGALETKLEEGEGRRGAKRKGWEREVQGKFLTPEKQGHMWKLGLGIPEKWSCTLKEKEGLHYFEAL